MTDTGLGVALTLLGVGFIGLVVARHRRTARRDFFFWIFLASTVIYIQLCPMIAMINGSLPVSRSIDVLSPVDFAHDYVVLETLALVLFQVPVTALYYAIAKTGRRRRTALAASTVRVRPFAVFAGLFAVVFLAALYHSGYVFARGNPEEKLLALPLVDYTIIRSYQTTGLFIIGILGITRGLELRRRDRRWMTRAFLVNLGALGVYAFINSRLAVLQLALVVVGVELVARGHVPRPSRRTARRIVRTALVVLVAYYFAGVALNIRAGSPNGVLAWHGSYFTAVGTNVFGDSASRLNCIDLMAQLKGPIQDQGPAMGDAWSNAKWQVERFVDRSGFNDFRASRATTSKTWLMNHYLGVDLQDYPSCTLTDFYGNFDFVGFLLAAVVFAGFFGAWARQLTGPRSGAWLLVALFFMTRALTFDQEASSLLFGWIQQAPILVAAIWLSPITVRRSDLLLPGRPSSRRATV